MIKRNVASADRSNIPCHVGASVSSRWTALPSSGHRLLTQMWRHSTSLLIFLPLGFALQGQDYFVKPNPASFIRDSNTTFLVNLTAPKARADFAVGNSQLTVDAGGFVVGGGYKGTFGFSTLANFPTNAWTLEMIIRLPYDAAEQDPILLGAWPANSQQLSFELVLQRGVGARTRIHCGNSADYFYLQPYAGGNGRSIQDSATDKWVYLAFGCDFAGQLCLTSAREVAGDILNQDVNFAPSPWMQTNFLSAFPVNQRPAELARRWQTTRQKFGLSMPATFTLGHPSVEIQAIRLSNRYRSEIFDVVPVLSQPSTDTWTPQSLAANRAQTQSVVRKVGYPGYNNFRTMTVNEPYLPLVPGEPAVSIQLTNVPVGLYTCFIYGAVDPGGRTSLARVWKPCPMDFQAKDAGGALLGRGRMLLKQSFVPRRMQGFQFHVDSQATNVTLTFSLPATARETAWLQKIVLVDQLAGFPNVAIKRAQNIAQGATNQLVSLTPARKNRDDLIWNALPPLNTHLQVSGQVAEFSAPSSGASTHTWVTKSLRNLALNQQHKATFSSLDFVNTGNGAIFSQSNILSTAAWPSPYGEDPTGVFFEQSRFPSLTTDIYNTKRAELLGYRYLLFLGAIVNSRNTLYGLELPLAYFNGGDPEIGHDAAMALVRWAYDWPALEMALHEIRLSTHSPDFESNSDWTDNPIRNGKMYYEGWSGDHAAWLLESYDQVFPYIANNQVFADAVRRFIPSVRTPQDVIRMLDRHLVYSSVRDSKLGLINPAVGVEDMAGEVLGPSQYTTQFFDLTKQFSIIYPAAGGTYQEMYATALSRSGVDYIGSVEVYAIGTAQDLITKASRIKRAKLAGIPVPMDLSDVSKYPKVRSAGNFLLDVWVAGGFPLMIGDASGGTHYGRVATTRLVAAKDAISKAFDLYADPRHAWVMKNLHGNTDPVVVSAAAGVVDPVLNAASRVVPDYGAILELTPEETNVLKKTAATLRLGIGSGHSHHDYLDLNLFAMGLPLSVDLACRNEQNNWSRPGANWSFLHNHALAHDSDDPNGAGSQAGEPWLRAFAPPLLSASYVDQGGLVRLDRDVVLMEVGNSGTFYAFDVQRLRGGLYHTWAFHGCESDSLALNVSTSAKTVRWNDRTLEGTHRVGTASATLQATWTMTRSGRSIPHSFDGGGTIDTVGCEPTVLGADYNPGLLPVKVRATLLGRAGDQVIQGNPYSDAYAYSFPFLWVQRTNEVESVYPAIYEWYRGSTAVVATAQILQNSPLQVRVITTSGQQDTYQFTSNACLAVSRDSDGVRWVKLSGSMQFSSADLVLQPAANYDVAITGINYRTRQLTTSAALPSDPAVVAGKAGRRIFLQLRGSGTTFTWDDDLLVQEGQITSLRVTGPDTISIGANQQVLFGGFGNRDTNQMVVTTEDGLWHFRGNRVLASPPGVALTTDVFSDANGDGRVSMRTYEIGVSDRLVVPLDITIKRGIGGWLVKANSSVNGTIENHSFSLPASTQWQTVNEGGPIPPRNLRVTGAR